MCFAPSAWPPVSFERPHNPYCISAVTVSTNIYVGGYTAKASSLHDAGPDEEGPARETRLPATLVRIPAEPRGKTGE